LNYARQRYFQFSQGFTSDGESVFILQSDVQWPTILLANIFYYSQSWSPKNLYNLWQRTMGPKSEAIKLKDTGAKSLFQQRWLSKAVVRAYHGDYIPEKIFKRWFLPETIPDVRPRRAVKSGDDKASLEDYARRKRRTEESEALIAQKGMPPVGSLMFSEVERRIDTVVFRACFTESIYEARRLVIHGDVLLNGKKVGSPSPSASVVMLTASSIQMRALVWHPET
jgi:ribosomal protein S4